MRRFSLSTSSGFARPSREAVQFVDESTDSDGVITEWSWDLGDGENASGQNPIHRYGLPGIYTITLVATDDDGLTGSTVQDVEVSLGPGDVDGDGLITVLDARLCLQIATGVISPTLELAAEVQHNQATQWPWVQGSSTASIGLEASVCHDS